MHSATAELIRTEVSNRSLGIMFCYKHSVTFLDMVCIIMYKTFTILTIHYKRGDTLTGKVKLSKCC